MSLKLPQTSFFKRHVLPPLLVFLVPAFAAWFFHYAERELDADILARFEKQVSTIKAPPDGRQEELLAFFRAVPISKIMALNGPEAAEAQRPFEALRFRYATFRWMQRVAWGCIVCTLATLLIVGVSVAFSFRSQSAQYRAIRIGWPVLRTSALLQVVGQGVLAVFLSFWVTAIFFEVYVLKLIILIGAMAAFAVAAMISAIFRKVDDRCGVSGRLIREDDAPALWQRVRHFAAQLGTAPPDHIIGGIDANFFVTEHPVQLDESLIEGRTLFISLPMLKILSVEEADAVLGHELAHFSGEDTLWSRKISPLMGKFGLYLQKLYEGLSIPIALFIQMFWNLYMFSIRRLSREREFRADEVGGSVASAGAMKRALIKVAGYCSYRANTVDSIVGSNRVNPELQLASELEQGFPDSLKAFTSDASAALTETPHPFDSHPPLHQRLEHLGFSSTEAFGEEDLHTPLAGTWHDSIPVADTIEQELWTAHQNAIQAYHGLDLAWRLMPMTPEEVAHVVAYFPARVFRHKDGTEATLLYDRLGVSSWAEQVMFWKITTAVADDYFTKKRLTITYHGQNGEIAKVKLNPLEFVSADGMQLLAAFEQYYGRHKLAEQRNGR